MRKLFSTILPFILIALATAMLVEAGARVWLRRVATDAQFRRFATLNEYRAKYERLGESPTPYLPHRYLGYVTSPNYRGVGKTQYRAALAEHNDVVRSLGAAGKAQVFDFAAAFPANADLFTDIIHLTADGGKTQARLIADYLVNAELLAARAGAAGAN